MASLLHRHYRIPDLNFRDFWDICGHYQRIHPKYRHILYTVDGLGENICSNEGDVSIVLYELKGREDEVTRLTARYYISPHSEPGDYGNAKMEYLPATYDFEESGLHFYSDSDNKLLLYQFEDFIYNGYTFDDDQEAEMEYGHPCEVLSAVVDMRGFSSFCEKPEIESPYTCGLMTAFYGMVRTGFKRYPPDLVKFLGDGVLAVWQTNPKDRGVAIDVCIEGLNDLPVFWKNIIRGPEFTHGAPEGIGSGLSFGLASKISIDNDYIGRPINIASRLCGTCPPGVVYIDRNVPNADKLKVKPMKVRVKSYGEVEVWMMENR